MPPSKTRPKSPVTIDNVAAAAGVSIATVSRVLNQTMPVAAETLERVLAAVEQLGYVPQTAARHLARGKTKTLGLLLPDVSNDFFSPLLGSITESAVDAGYDLLIAIRPTRRDNGVPRSPLGKQNTDGLLVFDQSIDEGELHRLHAARFPVVLLYRSTPQGVSFPCIMIEDKSGARQITEHLIVVHERRRIVFLRGPAGNEDSLLREQGYREALAAHGIAFDPSLVGDGEFYEAPARATVERWLAEGLEFDAIFAGDDGSASGALVALTRAGRRVPQDVSLVGFDDAPVARYLNPRLTTVRAPTGLVGREAIRQLIRLITTDEADMVTVLPTELVIRQSCGCPARA
ncbi:MAG TPA: LacI family DNA-binding transcriptional regulator [Roseiflexaceae bacterium]|jgi:DNA-binding LacI/PurR family transcriptional regulator